MSAAEQVARAFWLRTVPGRSSEITWAEAPPEVRNQLTAAFAKLIEEGVIRPSAAAVAAIPFALDPDRLLAEVREMCAHPLEYAVQDVAAKTALLLDWMASGGRFPAELAQGRKSGPIAWREQMKTNAHVARHWYVEGEDADGVRFRFVTPQGVPFPPFHSRPEAEEMCLQQLARIRDEGDGDRVFLVCPDGTQEEAALAEPGPGQSSAPRVKFELQPGAAPAWPGPEDTDG